MNASYPPVRFEPQFRCQQRFWPHGSRAPTSTRGNSSSSSSSGGSSSSRRRPLPLPTTLVDMSTTRAGGEGGKGGGGGEIAYKPTSTSQLPAKLNAFFQLLQLNKIMEFLLVFLGGKPMWIHRTATLARIFDGTPDIFDDSVFALASLGAMVQVRLTKQAFEN